MIKWLGQIILALTRQKRELEKVDWEELPENMQNTHAILHDETELMLVQANQAFEEATLEDRE